MFRDKDIIAASKTWVILRNKLKNRLSDMEINALPLLSLWISNVAGLTKFAEVLLKTYSLNEKARDMVKMILPLMITLVELGLPIEESIDLVNNSVTEALKELEEVK